MKFENHLSLIDWFYDAAGAPSAWPAVLQQIRTAFDAVVVNLFLMNQATRQIPHFLANGERRPIIKKSKQKTRAAAETLLGLQN